MRFIRNRIPQSVQRFAGQVRDKALDVDERYANALSDLLARDGIASVVPAEKLIPYTRSARTIDNVRRSEVEAGRSPFQRELLALDAGASMRYAVPGSAAIMGAGGIANLIQSEPEPEIYYEQRPIPSSSELGTFSVDPRLAQVKRNYYDQMPSPRSHSDLLAELQLGYY